MRSRALISLKRFLDVGLTAVGDDVVAVVCRRCGYRLNGRKKAETQPQMLSKMSFTPGGGFPRAPPAPPRKTKIDNSLGLDGAAIERAQGLAHETCICRGSSSHPSFLIGPSILAPVEVFKLGLGILEALVRVRVELEGPEG